MCKTVADPAASSLKTSLAYPPASRVAVIGHPSR
jgi:hypothetical protein